MSPWAFIVRVSDRGGRDRRGDHLGPAFLHPQEFFAMAISLLVKGRGDANRVTMEGVSFRTTNAFNIGSVGVALILIALYATWW